jgi:hypothetical protein
VLPKLGFLVRKYTIWQPCLEGLLPFGNQPGKSRCNYTSHTTCNGRLEFFVSIRYILWPFGTFFPCWYVVSRNI